MKSYFLTKWAVTLRRYNYGHIATAMLPTLCLA